MINDAPTLHLQLALNRGCFPRIIKGSMANKIDTTHLAWRVHSNCTHVVTPRVVAHKQSAPRDVEETIRVKVEGYLLHEHKGVCAYDEQKDPLLGEERERQQLLLPQILPTQCRVSLVFLNLRKIQLAKYIHKIQLTKYIRKIQLAFITFIYILY